MIVKHDFYIGMRDIDENNFITDKGLLAALEDTGGIHSEIAGFGISNLPKTKRFWMILSWHVEILRRPKFNETITVSTWSKPCRRLYVYRDFEVYDSNKNLIATAGSKWVFINTENNSIVKATDEMFKSYEIEPTKSSTNPSLLEKLKEPQKYSNVVNYTINKQMIDINGHVHNLDYLDLAYMTLPEEIYKVEFNKIDVMYKKEIKLGEMVKCFYSYEGKSHIVTIKSEDEKILHSIIKFE
ncbi:MAG: hypothetical protein IKM97_01135 [Clostridia bacterium]|nr:hypothetical protein [Clostridia bacterium]